MIFLHDPNKAVYKQINYLKGHVKHHAKNFQIILHFRTTSFDPNTAPRHGTLLLAVSKGWWAEVRNFNKFTPNGA